ncbi:MAG TPA: hypothetical protein VFQ78_16290 [Candidatus Udaeobacter sp.]|nr:hypothetical protein [Candidatus Udaeobacter sp.]
MQCKGHLPSEVLRQRPESQCLTDAQAIIVRSLRQHVSPAIVASPAFIFAMAAFIASSGWIEATAEKRLDVSALYFGHAEAPRAIDFSV